MAVLPFYGWGIEVLVELITDNYLSHNVNVYNNINVFFLQNLDVCLMGKMGLILKWEEREQINERSSGACLWWCCLDFRVWYNIFGSLSDF